MKAIFPVLDENRSRPYYLQLYDYIRNAISAGEIMEGEKLPSLRTLAKSTGLSITTVKQAYDQLLVEGYVHSKAQSGYYAGKVFPLSEETVPSEKSIFSSEMFSVENELSVDTGNFKYDPSCFDFNKWKKCMNKILTEYPSVLFFESDPQGEAVLRAQIAKYLYLSRGVLCSPAQIIIGAGTQQITNQLATILQRLGIEHVALETPGYVPVKNIFRDRGFAITPVGVAEEGLIIEKLPTNIRTAAYVSPSNHILTGEVMPVGRRYELLSWAAGNNSYIIEDDYDSELRYFGKPVPALKSLERSDRVIYLGSFSSTLFAAVKISYMVLPSEIAQLFSSMAKDYTQTCSKLEQLTLAMFMETGNYQTHIKKLRKLYAQKLAAVTDTFARRASRCIRVRNTSSGISVILQIIGSEGDASQGAFPEAYGNIAKDISHALKKEADALGLPVVVLGKNLLVFYYNHIPLSEISSSLESLMDSWEEIVTSSSFSTS